MDAHPFNVYCAGETLSSTDLSVLYVQVTQVVPDERGRIRLTSEEARAFGGALIAAADFNDTQEEEG